MGDRAISVGCDAINSLLVIGDHNTFFVGRYERLADAFLDPRALLLALLAAVAEPVPATFLARRIGQRTSVVEARLEEQCARRRHL